MVEIIHTPLVVVHVIACLFLMLVVLVQPGKSGGLGAFTGAGAQQVFGGRGAGNFLTRTTWATASIFFATSITLAYLSSSADESLQKRAESAQQKQKQHLPPPAPVSSAKK
ncbi:MAG: preprotein translocase subunit SecG [Myxococcota bacterium]